MSTNGKIALALAGVAGVAVVVFAILAPLGYAVGGYFIGWVLADLFTFAGRWVISGAQALGVDVAIGQLPEIGALLGFVGAFFKSTQTNKNEKS